MKVEYEKTMMDRLMDVWKHAIETHSTVKCVRLCKKEWKTLHRELDIDMSGYDYSGKKGTPACHVYGMRVEYSDESMSTVCHEYEGAGTSVSLGGMVHDLRQERKELKKEKATLLEMNRAQVGMIKQQRSLKEEALEEVGDLMRELHRLRTINSTVR